MPRTPLRVGLIGYGYAGRTFHAPLVAAVPGLALAAVASRDAARVHADWPAVDVVGDAHAFVTRDDLDLVVIATPNDTHHPLARAALQAGRHVVVDKPFTLTLAEARELTALAEARGRLLSVFHNRRWDGDFLTLRALLARGTLGRVVHLESHFDRFRPLVQPRWRESAGPGAGLWNDLGPHLLDQALQLFGWPQGLALAQARLRDGALADDWFDARLRYPGLQVTLHASTLSAAPGARFTVHGTRGSWVKQGLDVQEDGLRAGARPCWPHAPGWGIDPGDSRLTLAAGDALADQALPLRPGCYADFYAAIRDALCAGAPNPVPPAEAVAVMALLELGQRSERERRECTMPAPPGYPLSR